MMSQENSIFETAIQRRQLRSKNSDTKFSWLESSTPANRRRQSSLFETTKEEETKGFIAQLKEAPRFNSASETLPFVTCYCDGTECIALLNTTLTKSTIRKDFANKLSDFQTNRRRHIGLNIHTTRLSLGSTATSFQLLIVDSEPNVCLGIDFFKKMHACLNFKENCLILANDKIPFKSAKEILLSTL